MSDLLCILKETFINYVTFIIIRGKWQGRNKTKVNDNPVYNSKGKSTTK